MGTKRRKPGWALAEAVPRDVVKVLNVQGMRGEEEEHVDEGLTLWTEEYPEEKESGFRPCGFLLASVSASQKLSSSLDRARQCSSLSSSVIDCSLMDIIEAIEIAEEVSELTVNHFGQSLHKLQTQTTDSNHTLYYHPSSFVHDSKLV